MLIEEGSKYARENVLRDRGRNSEGKLSGDLSILRAKFLFRFGNEGGYFLRVAEQEGSLRSKRDAIGGAIEEANAEIVFEPFDLKRDGGLSEEEVFRRLAKIQMFCNGSKHLQAKVFQLGHGMIIHWNGQTREPVMVPPESNAPLKKAGRRRLDSVSSRYYS